MKRDYENLDFGAEKWLDNLTKIIREQEAGPQILDVKRVQEMQLAEEVIKKEVMGEDVEFFCEVNKPFLSMGSISVEGKILAVADPDWFHVVAGLASNMEIYPLTNGKIRMTFTFHGLTKSIQ